MILLIKRCFLLLPIVDNIDPDHMQKQNFRTFDFLYGKWRPKVEKTPKKWIDPLPFRSAYPSKSLYGSQKCMKLFVVVVPTTNPIASEKMHQKSIYKGLGAVALILALLPFLRPRGQKSKN